MKKMLSLFLPFLICTLLACSTYTDKEKNTFDHQIQKYVRGNQLHCQRSSSGLYYSISDPGSGPTVQYTDSVRFVYSGRLLNGSLFDIQKKTVTFKVRDLIAGWKEIMLQLKPGAKVFLIIPPQLGYGERKLGKIPKNSILVFDLEIKEVV